MKLNYLYICERQFWDSITFASLILHYFILQVLHKTLRAWRTKSGKLQLPNHFLSSNDTKISNPPHVRDIRNPTAGLLVTIPITFSRHTRPVPPFFLSPALFCETSAIRSIDRCRRRRAGKTAKEDIACLLASPKKGLILGIPRARTRQVRVTQLGDSCDDNGEYKGGKSPLEQDQSSFSNLLDRMLYPRGNSLVGVRVEGTGKREEVKEPSGKRKRERAKKRFLNSRSDRPGPSIPERFVCIAGLDGI